MAPAPQFVDVHGTVLPAMLSPAVLLPKWLAALETWALPVWSAGVLIFATRLIFSARYVVRLRREGELAGDSLSAMVACLARRMNVRRPVRVLISRLIDSPAVAGWLHPAILVPAASLLRLTAAQLEAVLAHELAHIRRCDYVVNLLQTVGETLFFYQPALWWLSSRIRRERELCCDDLVVEVCGDRVGYARALTQLERARTSPSPDLAMASTAGPLMHRIQRLTGEAEVRPSSKAPAVVVMVLATACCAMSVNWAHAQPQTTGAAEVHRDAIWVDTVKFGDLPILVRALGTLTSASTAQLNVPSPQADELRPGQNASIQTHGGITAAGKTTGIGALSANGTVPVTVQLQSPLEAFEGQQIDGVVRIKTLHDVWYVGRPAMLASTIFRVDPDGNSATRVKVRFGAVSVNSVQVLEGLQPGDRVILSDLSRYQGYDRIHLE